MDYLNEDDEDMWFSFWTSRNYSNNGISHSHVFACRFGDIRSISMRGGESVDVELKNGEIFHLKGGSNDIGTKVKIIDEEIGQMDIKWSRISTVEFMETRLPLKNNFGSPLYGTVYTSEGEFTGQIQWDHDERVGSDILDGETKDGDVSIEFNKIKNISKEGRGCRITLQSGKEMFLSGSNDVNSENRGIIVSVPDMGRIDLAWREFVKVVFSTPETEDAKGYNDFPDPKPLRGTVMDVDGQSLSGRLIFDLDEEWDSELLQGETDGMEYIIPFRNIKKITRRTVF